MERPDTEGKQHQFRSWRTKGYKLKLMQVNASKPSHQEENTNFYNTVDKTFEKPNIYTIVIGDFNAHAEKIMNIIFQCKSLNGVTKTEIAYIITNRPDIVMDRTLINQVINGSDHRIAMNNIKLDVEVIEIDEQEAIKSIYYTTTTKEARIAI